MAEWRVLLPSFELRTQIYRSSEPFVMFSPVTISVAVVALYAIIWGNRAAAEISLCGTRKQLIECIHIDILEDQIQE